ncbi:radical SAM protein [Aquimarina sp. 2201CG5-10]|uniref:SPL family radical SAM protein n=1 Tax=Aquimarina callyspongiae TaxID=3098150 RepID=UPI002AB42EAC|nr:radical SAM protein [Aquimarina sp. 2201CG5-10]MDY8135626.1 radical SAM protein [Aquimarina sp. 2201CG5-10]
MPREIEVKSVLNKTKKRDSWFLDDYTVNLYSSCSFNCLYCYIRGSKYGTNLEKSLSVKINAIEILDRQLYNRAKKNQYGIIVLSSATDPYLQIEKEYQLTREALKVILKHKFPVHIITKSELIKRDFDLLHQIDKTAILPNDLKHLRRGAIISFSFSTLSDSVAKIFEPGATPPSQRLNTLNLCLKEDFFTGVSLMPLLPFISDTTEHLKLLFSTFKSSNVKYLLPATLTLFGQGSAADGKTLMLKAIKKHYPELESRYIKYFNIGYEMPKYYKEAFYNKMNELCSFYKINNSILKALEQH